MEELTTKKIFKIDLIQLLIIIFIDYLYGIFITTPISVLKAYSRHPISITLLFVIFFPIYLFIKCIISTVTFISSLRQLELKGLFSSQFIVISKQHTTTNDDDMQQWLEKCSICFESKLDLCLEYCKDQFCLNCFQQYVSEVVKSSWGLNVTKIRCPVCRVYIPQSEWTKYLPVNIVELYNKFNEPYRSFSRSCPHCETEVTPCDQFHAKATLIENQSKFIASLLKEYFTKANSNITTEQRVELILPSFSYQHRVIKLFQDALWRNATLPDIHKQLITKLLLACKIIDQISLVKSISQQILKLDTRPDTWRRLQFDYISFFSHIDCPACDKVFCLQCGHNDAHINLTCKENMKQQLTRYEEQQIINDFVKTLKWELENSRNCPSCSIMIHRDEGCNKVDCALCGFSFCWECKSTWSNGCGFFNCLAKNKAASLDLVPRSNFNDRLPEDMATTVDDNHENRTELGVPDIDSIRSRLNNNSNF